MPGYWENGRWRSGKKPGKAYSEGLAMNKARAAQDEAYWADSQKRAAAKLAEMYSRPPQPAQIVPGARPRPQDIPGPFEPTATFSPSSAPPSVKPVSMQALSRKQDEDRVWREGVEREQYKSLEPMPAPSAPVAAKYAEDAGRMSRDLLISDINRGMSRPVNPSAPTGLGTDEVLEKQLDPDQIQLQSVLAKAYNSWTSKDEAADPGGLLRKIADIKAKFRNAGIA